jgi:hypothetical protein
MIKPLRKRHLQIWTIIGVLLPIGIICAWLVVPKQVRDNLLQPAHSAALPVLIKSIVKDNYEINLRTGKDSSALQLEWINKSALTAPSAIIYKLNPPDTGINIDKADLIGRIDSRGIYHFALKSDSGSRKPQFVLYDIIHHQVIDQINF